MAPFIALEGITKRYGALVANAAIDLEIEAGEIHALLGENGAGKSTLMKVLYGLIAPDVGTIRIEGKPVALSSPKAARAHGIGMVFQHFSLFEDFTALENIAIPLEGEVAGADLRRRVTEKAAHFGLAIELDRPVHTLSAGERQRIEILRALMQAPRLLILDEPTSVLTPQEAEALFVTLELLSAEGMAILFISHKLEEVRRLCSRATILRAGRVVGEADPRNLSAAELARLMMGEGVADLAREDREIGQEAALAVTRLNTTPDTVHGVTLRDIDLVVRKGEIVAVAGIAGNGQSELYAAISGEGGKVQAGAICLLGEDVTRKDINARRRLGAAFVPEARLGQATLPQAVLSDNVILSWHATEQIGAPFLDRSRLADAARGIVERFDVRVPEADPAAMQLSGGNLQKFIVGREILRGPQLLVIDQPSWGVDARAAANIRQNLLALAKDGAGVLVITQDLDEALELADTIVVMNEGRSSAPLAARDASRERIGLLMSGQEQDA
ncbi:MAG: ABC transporter ATP-binding protein [Proteobacteria bacterium]|nr:ABC transporter ATP-binding protein [Pseudomonadota bacterium]